LHWDALDEDARQLIIDAMGGAGDDDFEAEKDKDDDDAEREGEEETLGWKLAEQQLEIEGFTRRTSADSEAVEDGDEEEDYYETAVVDEEGDDDLGEAVRLEAVQAIMADSLAWGRIIR
jgi:hypothetical protein